MLTNLIYLAVFVILVFVLSIAVKAITRGVEAKQIIKDEKSFDLDSEKNIQNSEVVNQIKELKDEKKEYETFILEFMQSNHENVINISDGKLRVNKSTTKAALKQESIQSSLFDLTRDPNKALQMTKYILDNRPLAERVNLKRTKNRPSKKKKKDKDI